MSTKIQLLVIIIVIILIAVVFFWSKSNESGLVSNVPESAWQNGESNIENDGLYTADTEESILEWEGSKTLVLNYFDSGIIKLSEGSINISEGVIVGGKFVIDMASIETKNVGNNLPASRLTDHLKSEDFFAVELFPTAEFEILGVSENGIMRGNLTIKGKTNEISFPVSVVENNGEILLSGLATVDRTMWGIVYGSGSFFDNLGNNVIDNNFKLKFEIKARR